MSGRINSAAPCRAHLGALRVVPITAVRDRQLATTLRQLLEIAERGELRGALICAEDILGTEKFFSSGSYRARPGHGTQAAMRLAMRMGNLADEREEEEEDAS